jgi:deoxyadenosine/deoxycytidine kinase
MKKFIAVAGNIGVGKSTLVSLLTKPLGCKPLYEPVVENPYLANFYQDMAAWGFHSQVFFLGQRLKIHYQVQHSTDSIIMDRSIYEDAEIFACNLHKRQIINARDFDTYWTLYQAMADFLTPPDLLIYLRASVPTLLERIAKRGREYEMNISAEYLMQLNDLYEKWIQEFILCPVLTVPTDRLDYVSFAPHLELIVKKVQQKLNGKDEVIFDVEEIT